MIALIAAFGAALVISAAIHENKGAECNRAWVVIALALTLEGLSEGGRAGALLGFPVLSSWNDKLIVVSSLFFLIGAILWLRLVKKAAR